MSPLVARHEYTIKEAAALTGLPASTLRYYESIGVIAPVDRGASSGHRVYDEDALDQITWVACLAATGMSVSDMRQYVANGQLGPSAAGEQVELLTHQQRRLQAEAGRLVLRQRYVALKIDYWRAVAGGDGALADRLSGEARTLADELKRTGKPYPHAGNDQVSTAPYPTQDQVQDQDQVRERTRAPRTTTRRRAACN